MGDGDDEQVEVDRFEAGATRLGTSASVAIIMGVVEDKPGVY